MACSDGYLSATKSLGGFQRSKVFQHAEMVHSDTVFLLSLVVAVFLKVVLWTFYVLRKHMISQVVFTNGTISL